MIKTLTISESNLEEIVNSLNDFDYTDIEIGEFQPLYVKLVGDQFHGSFTPSIMKGIVELQEGINRSYCFAKYGNYDLMQLSDIELKKLELIISIKEGSTDIIGDLIELAKSLKDLLAGMTPRQRATIILSIILSLGGYFTLSRLMEHNEHLNDNETKVALEQEKTKQLSEIQENTLEAVKLGLEHSDQQKQETKELQEQTPTKDEPTPKPTQEKVSEYFKLLEKPTPETLQALETIKNSQPQISETMINANTKFIRSMKFAEKVNYNNAFEASGDVLEKITQTPRNTWQEVILIENFRVVDINSSKVDYRTVALRSDDGRELTARFTDKSISKDKFNRLTKAMYGYNPINLSVRARELNGKLKDGIIEQVREIDTSRDYRV